MGVLDPVGKHLLLTWQHAIRWELLNYIIYKLLPSWYFCTSLRPWSLLGWTSQLTFFSLGVLSYNELSVEPHNSHSSLWECSHTMSYLLNLTTHILLSRSALIQWVICWTSQLTFFSLGVLSYNELSAEPHNSHSSLWECSHTMSFISSSNLIQVSICALHYALN